MRSSFLLAVVLGAALVRPAIAAGETPAPAPFTPLRVGTVLDYGSWKCTVSFSDGSSHSCRGPAGEEARFYGKLVPFGPIPAGGYGSKMHVVNCEWGRRSTYFESHDIKSVSLAPADRQALGGMWPLQVGKSVTFRRNFRPLEGSAKSTIRVTGTKTVTVLGKEREVYVLEGKTTKIFCVVGSTRTINTSFQETWWYAPDLAAVAHYELNWARSKTFPNVFSYDLKAIVSPGPTPIVQARPAPVASAGPAAPKQPSAVAADTSPPVIDVQPQLRTVTPIIFLAGRVSDESKIVEVTVDGRAVPLKPDGSFSVSRGVAHGESTLTVKAIDEWGNARTRRVAVTRLAITEEAAPPRVATSPMPSPPANPLAGIHFGKYHAIIIGNNDYQNLADLKMAVNDARAVAKLLTDDYGFDVRLAINATRGDVIRELARMRARLTPNDNLLVYYAGHGVVDRIAQVGYWLPVDAENDVPTNWVSTGDLTAMLRAMRAKHVLVVADSCYSGTLVRAADVHVKTARERNAWIKRIVRKRARTALVSGGLEPVADGGGGSEHSVFANAFLTALSENKGVLDGEGLFNAIKRPVALNSDQTPQYSDIRKSGHEGGDFVFVRR